MTPDRPDARATTAPGPVDLPPPNPPRVVALVVVAIVLVAFSLRTPITSLGALLPDVRADLGLGAGTAGFLTSVPVLVFGLAGALVPAFGRRASTGRLVTLSLLAVAVGAAGRVTGGAAVLVLGTVVAMAGIAVVNVVLPVIVRGSFPRRQGWLTGLYVAVMQVGAAIASATAVPLGEAFGGWRWGLGWWAAPVVGAIGAWLVADRAARPPAHGRPTPSALTWRDLVRDRTAVALAVLFGVQSLCFYAMAGWLPTILRDLGLGAERAGSMTAVALTVMVPAALLAPAWVAGLDDQRWFVPAVATPWIVGMVGLLVAPTTWTPLWMVLVGLGLTSFPIALLLVGMRSATAVDTAPVSAFVQGVGYLVALPGPLLIGLLRDWTGSWTVSLVALTACIVPIGVAGLLAARDVTIGPARRDGRTV